MGWVSDSRVPICRTQNRAMSTASSAAASSEKGRESCVLASVRRREACYRVSRRYAAGRCADAQNAPRKRGDRTAPYGDG